MALASLIPALQVASGQQGQSPAIVISRRISAVWSRTSSRLLDPRCRGGVDAMPSPPPSSMKFPSLLFQYIDYSFSQELSQSFFLFSPSSFFIVMMRAYDVPSVIFLPANLGMTPSPPSMPTMATRGVSPCPFSMENRRLESFRHRVREQCQVEGMSACLNQNPPAAPMTRPQSSSSFPVAMGVVDSGDYLSKILFMDDGLLDAFLKDSNALDEVDLEDGMDMLETLLHDMMGVSIQMFDAALMAEQEESSSMDEQGDEREEIAEQIAENALDGMVASFFQRATSSSSSSSSSDKTGSKVHVVMEESPGVLRDNLSDRFSQLGAEILSHQRRRLSEGEADPHANVKERLARRLTEYRTDLFLYPDGTLTMYTSAIAPSLGSRGLDTSGPTPILGMGSESMDRCILRQYDNMALSSSCTSAVSDFLNILSDPDHSLTSEYSGRKMSFSKEMDSDHVTYSANICIETIMLMLSVLSIASCCALCTGFLDIWNLALSALIFVTSAFFGVKFLLLSLPCVILLDYFFGDDHDEEDEDEDNDDDIKDRDVDGYDYVKIEDDDSSVPTRNAQSGVFIGVPVQVV